MPKVASSLAVILTLIFTALPAAAQRVGHLTVIDSIRQPVGLRICGGLADSVATGSSDRKVRQWNVFGTVFDSAHKPICDAEIRFGLVDSVGLTAQDGTFRIGPLPAWEQTMVVTAPGYEGRAVPVINCGDGFYALTLMPQHVPRAMGTLQGRVVDGDGKPIIGATVRLFGTRQRGISKAPDGHFTILGVPYGKWNVVVSAIGQGQLRMNVTIDSVSHPLLLSLKERVATGFCDLPASSNRILHGQAATVRETSSEEIDRSARPTLFSPASP